MTAARSGGPILCAGSAHWDVIGRAAMGLARGDDVPGSVEHRPGGVALNVAAGLARRGMASALSAVVGESASGAALLAHIDAAGIDRSAVVTVPGDGPGGYVAIEDETGELVAAIAGVRAIEDHADEMIDRVAVALGTAAGLFVETNLSEAAIGAMGEAAHRHGVSVTATAVNPVSAGRLRPLLQPDIGATLIVNLGEANQLLGETHPAEAAARALRAAGAGTAIVTDGPRPAALATADGVMVRPPPPATRRTVTGAGDALIAAYLARRPAGDLVAAFEAGLQAAAAQISGERG